MKGYLMWHCPHCTRRVFSPRDGLVHIAVHHKDCWSCEVESIVLKAILNGTAMEVGETVWFERPRSDPA